MAVETYYINQVASTVDSIIEDGAMYGHTVSNTTNRIIRAISRQIGIVANPYVKKQELERWQAFNLCQRSIVTLFKGGDHG